MADLYPGKVYVGDKDGGGWTHIGETTGPAFQFTPPVPYPDLEPVPWPKFPVTLSITVDYSDAAAAFRRLVRQMIRLIRDGKRARHSQRHEGKFARCRACHPEQDRRPLAVNGHDYRKRQLARQRRRRRA